MENELRKLAAAMRDMSDMVGDHHWQAAKAIDELMAMKSEKFEPGEKLGADGLEVVAYECLSGLHVSLSYEPFGDNPVPLWRAPDAQRAIAELRDRLDVMIQCADNYSRMFEESAEECEHLKACQENAMLHMTGLVAERNTLLQQLAERDARIAWLEDERTKWGPEILRLGDENQRLIAALESQQAASVGGEPYPHGHELHKAVFMTLECFTGGDTFEAGVRSLIAELKEARAALSPAGGGVAPDALSRAFITCESVDGNYRVVIKSATLQETQQVHNWLARLNAKPQANSQEGSK